MSGKEQQKPHYSDLEILGMIFARLLKENIPKDVMNNLLNQDDGYTYKATFSSVSFFGFMDFDLIVKVLKGKKQINIREHRPNRNDRKPKHDEAPEEAPEVEKPSN